MNDGTNLAQMNFQRRPGTRGGCSCCGFYMAGLLALPAMALAAFLVIF